MSNFIEIPYWFIRDLINRQLTYSPSIDNGEDDETGYILNPIIFDRVYKESEIKITIKSYISENVYEYRDVRATLPSYDEHNLNVQINEENEEDYDFIENGDEVYIRKGSYLHNLIISHFEETNEEITNINKNFLYLGKIYWNEDNLFYIEVYNLYFYAINALPEYVLNKRLKEFLKLALDNVFGSIYNRKKFIWTLIDSNEVPIEYIDHITRIFNINVSDFYTKRYDEESRLFTGTLPELLKRKGTYSSIFSIGQLNTNQQIRVYERWHDVFWDQEDEENVEVIDDEPYLHPDNTDTDYKLNPEPHFTDFNYIDYYRYAFSKYWEYSYDYDNHPSVTRESSITQTFNNLIEKIKPAKIENLENMIEFYFQDEFKGVASIVEADYVDILDFSEDGASNTITHDLGTENILIQLYYHDHDDYGYELLSPRLIRIVDENNVYVRLNEPADSVRCKIIEADYTFNIDEEKNEWEIVHSMFSTTPLVQVFAYNDDSGVNEKISPREIIHLDPISSLIKFEEGEFKKGFVAMCYPDTITAPQLESYGRVGASEATDVKISPHYRVEVDISDNPYKKDGIFISNLANTLYNAWEMVRPVQNYSHYNIYIKAKTDFSSDGIGLYDEDDPAIFHTNYIGNFSLTSGSYSKPITEASDEWVLRHNLSWPVIVQCYNENMQLISPKNINISNPNITVVEFSKPESGYVFITGAKWTWEQTTSEFEGDGYGILESYEDKSRLSPKSFVLNTDDDTFMVNYNHVIKTKLRMDEPNVTFEQTTPSDEWIITYSKSYYGITQFFDDNWNQIYPKTVYLESTNRIIAEFDKEISGFALIKFISGNLEDTGQIDDVIDSIKEGAYIKIGDGKSGKSYNPSYDDDIESPLQYDGKDIVIDIDEDTIEEDKFFNKVNFKGYCKVPKDLEIYEMGLFLRKPFDDDELIFYSYHDEIYKTEEMDYFIEYEIYKTA